mmetsp:Transcript_3356/g.4863  ORF Transcript_3356/g.4863 Transcript_3356/m.4863 type:complete len:80 (+) Transcript_3356:130-369(+)
MVVQFRERFTYSQSMRCAIIISTNVNCKHINQNSESPRQMHVRLKWFVHFTALDPSILYGMSRGNLPASQMEMFRVSTG